ncbi:hypothetical protein SISNIDRAFT_460135 [Sistotremastrum niveocremeum HHB9708]|uniref:Conidiation protein 6 n=2 Tax=Sistotremastraceae TaxID=3402574 RepID=A0A164NVC7_9AGAM|nr:hypothetical protein SISNIDRAFT_460135 [Sistotremastrum niveocremeum HHB9708]KZT40499.1 hypothetical protein SISSUDRAFT_1044214 [Sistotremastrum suecicum HHB10207 ss-3]
MSSDAAVASESNMELDAHTTHVLRGHKATISNPNTSDEAKAHSTAILAEHGISYTPPNPSSSKPSIAETINNATSTSTENGVPTVDGKSVNQVIGGYKASLMNPYVSAEAKERSLEILEAVGVDVRVDSSTSSETGPGNEGQVVESEESS